LRRRIFALINEKETKMQKIVTAVTLAFVSVVIALPAHAGKGGPTPVTSITKQSRKDNKIFVGINWNFGVREGITGVVGYRFARVNASDRVRGGLIDLTVPLTGAPIQLGEVHVKALAGSRSVQGELGVGYGFQGAAFLLNGGVRVPYANVGTDYLIDKGWQPYIGVDTLKRARPHTETTTTICPNGNPVTPGGSCAA